jgi:hypothetical protein
MRLRLLSVAAIVATLIIATPLAVASAGVVGQDIALSALSTSVYDVGGRAIFRHELLAANSTAQSVNLISTGGELYFSRAAEGTGSAGSFRRPDIPNLFGLCTDPAKCATWPPFAIGLGVLGLMSWRRKQKAVNLPAA